MSVRAMTWVWCQQLNAGQKLVLLALADHADGQGVCWPGQEGIADKCCMSRQTVNTHINNLIKAGLVTQEYRYDAKGHRKSSLYRLNLDRNIAQTTKAYVKNPDVGNPDVGNPYVGIFSEKDEPMSKNPTLGFLTTININRQVKNNRQKEEPSQYCSEPKNPATEQHVPQPVIMTIPLIPRDGEFAVTEAHVAELQDAYPGVDVTAQLKKIRLWCLDNPAKRKTINGVRRFISGWMGRTQDKAASKGNGKDKSNVNDFRGYV